MSKICKNCGAGLEDDQTFCRKCLTDSDVAPEERDKIRLKALKKKKTAIIIAVIAVVLIAVAIGIVFLVNYLQAVSKISSEKNESSLSVLHQNYPGLFILPEKSDPLSDEFDNIYEKDRPDEIKNYVIVRIKDDENASLFDPDRQELVWDRDVHPDYGDWLITEDNADKMDVIVVAVPSYRYAHYRMVGASSAEFSHSTEDIDLYYFNPKTKTFFCHEQVKGESNNKADTTISDDTVISHTGEELRVNGVADNRDRRIVTIVLISLGAICGIGLVIVAVDNIVTRKKEKKKETKR